MMEIMDDPPTKIGYGYRTEIRHSDMGYVAYIYAFGNSVDLYDRLVVFDFGDSEGDPRYYVYSTREGMDYHAWGLGGLRNAVCDIVGDTEEAIDWLLMVGL